MALNFEKISVMIVEDAMPMNNLIRLVLDKLGIPNIFCCFSGDEAFRVFCEKRPDIVISDWIMDDGDGLDLTQKIRFDDRSPNKVVPIVLLTGYNSKKRVLMARDAGVTEYLVKPFTAKDIAARIAYVINNPRDFIQCSTFFGPERRRKVDLSYSGNFRRRTDNSKLNTEGSKYEIPG
jgi:two-component system, chemotaxis family, chemotaxis protein CheY